MNTDTNYGDPCTAQTETNNTSLATHTVQNDDQEYIDDRYYL